MARLTGWMILGLGLMALTAAGCGDETAKSPSRPLPAAEDAQGTAVYFASALSRGDAADARAVSTGSAGAKELLGAVAAMNQAWNRYCEALGTTDTVAADSPNPARLLLLGAIAVLDGPVALMIDPQTLARADVTLEVQDGEGLLGGVFSKNMGRVRILKRQKGRWTVDLESGARGAVSHKYDKKMVAGFKGVAVELLRVADRVAAERLSADQANAEFMAAIKTNADIKRLSEKIVQVGFARGMDMP